MRWMRSVTLSFTCLLVLSTTALACQENDMVRSPGSTALQSPRGAPKADKPLDEEPGGKAEKPPEPPGGAVTKPPPPLPSAGLPKNPASASAALEKAHRSLDALVARWTKQGARPGARLESEIELWALYQQRLYRSIAKSPGTRAVVAGLSPPVAAAARANIGAQRDLYRLSQPVEPPVKLPRAKPAPARELLRYFKQADRKIGVPWHVLASVNFIETRFGRLKGPSTAGALGPMQFLPSTWDRYGNGGDIHDPRDAILGAARYLAASGAPGDMRGALYSYNNSDLYVNAILDYAKRMQADPRDFFAYYHWQVFVRTTKGDLQLTGPGSA
jgi:Transglycosylase SLT domain